MDHAEAIDRLATAFTGPGRLASLETDESVEGRELRQHLETCVPCGAEVEAWRLTAFALAAATPDSVRAPAGARERILAAVATAGVSRGTPAIAVAGGQTAALSTPPQAPARSPRLMALPGRSDRTDLAEGPRPEAASHASPGRVSGVADRLRFSWLAVAAAIAVLLFVGGALLGPRLGFTQDAGDRARGLTQVITGIDAILQQPGHAATTLRTTNGQVGGTVVVDPVSGKLAVVSTALVDQPAQTYDCYFVRGATKTKIGRMFFSDQTSFWVGMVPALSHPGQPGDMFEVRLGGTAGTLSLSGSF
jgi:hypothetical protein